MSFRKWWMWWKWWGCGCRAYSVHRKGGPSAAPVGPNYTRILTLTVPASTYAVFGKTEIQTSSQAGSDCQLAYDDGSGELHVDETGQTPGTDTVSGMSSVVHNLEAIIAPASSATVWIHARASQTWGAVDSKLIAIEVASATDQEVNA
jgi:hypothetical protein